MRPASCNTKCPRHAQKIKSPCMFGSGPETADIMIVGRDPGQSEDKKGKVFVGLSGELLNSILDEVGLDRDDIYITNAVKCGLPGTNKEPGKKETGFCRCHLVEEIERTKPNVIVAFGNTALDSLLGRTGVLRLQNHVFFSDEFKTKVIPVLHPAYCLRNPGNNGSIETGLRLAKKESRSKEILYRPKTKTRYLVADSAKKINQVFDQLEKQSAFSFDLETSALNFLKSDTISIQFSWQIGLGVTVPWELLDEGLMKRLKDLMKSNTPKILKIGQNIKFDIKHLMAHGVRVRGPFWDTAVAHSLIDDTAFDHKLESLVLKYTDMGEYWTALDKFKKTYCKEHKIKEEDFSYAFIPKEILFEYGAKDADATFRLYKVFEELLVEEEVEEFFYKQSMPLLPILLEMEYRGIKVDRDGIQVLIGKNQKILEGHAAEIRGDENIEKYEKYKARLERKKQIAKLRQRRADSETLMSRWPDEDEYVKKYLKEKPHEFNMGSAVQLKELFFGMMKLKPIKLTKAKQPSTDKDVMKILAEEHGIELAVLMDKHRKVAHFLSTFLHPVFEKSELDGRIHTSYIQSDVVSGRLSSRNPAMQNLPKKAIDFRSCFLADPGYVFVKADAAQAEFRVWAHDSNDKDMVRDIEAGLDIHTQTAMEVFGIGESGVTEHLRDAAKRGTFGMMYGIGAKTLAFRFKISLDEAESINAIFSAKYPVAAKWIKGQVKHAHLHKYVRSWMGRKRRLPHIDSDDHNVMSKAERQAMNSPIQAAASDMNNTYMVRSIRKARKANIDCYPAMTTHDENVIQVIEDQASDLILVMKEVVATTFSEFRCKMQLDFKVGKSIGTAKEVV